MSLEGRMEGGEKGKKEKKDRKDHGKNNCIKEWKLFEKPLLMKSSLLLLLWLYDKKGKS